MNEFSIRGSARSGPFHRDAGFERNLQPTNLGCLAPKMSRTLERVVRTIVVDLAAIGRQQVAAFCFRVALVILFHQQWNAVSTRDLGQRGVDFFYLFCLPEIEIASPHIQRESRGSCRAEVGSCRQRFPYSAAEPIG